ncbi:transcriptional regulator [Streptomyces sp. WAC 06783]|uniref:winged helix-turn-helix transcriptional regulator n=1 Tax=Streptomyces TaxID=1883 RepID=UPI00067A77DE|nr:helix-turn-helix domain-containing protein [Streptomyces sp. WAC 06783]RSO05347.1 transcriptional regulator [Streptomyces sp. WAC 06783]
MNAEELKAASSAIGLISRKWDLSVLVALQATPRGHSEMVRRTGLDRKQLTRVLRRLESAGLVHRSVDTVRSPIRVWYRLTKAGQQLLQVVAGFADWWEKDSAAPADESRSACLI